MEGDFYVVQKNYYFVAGDNFFSSGDSRNWGFIPENKINRNCCLNAEPISGIVSKLFQANLKGTN
jgi:hypothetical protein